MASSVTVPVATTDLAAHWSNVFRLLDRVRKGNDPEAVHDARVASRRLRAAMDAAAPGMSAKWFRRLHVDARKITRLLGRLRDAEVMLGQANRATGQADDKELPGWRHLQRQLKREERQERQLVKRRLKRFDASYRKRAKKRLASTADASSRESDAPRLDPSFIAQHAADVLALGTGIRKATDPATFHDLRIKIKHLRYSLEFADAAGTSNERMIDALKHAQEVLGNLHDCDVLIERLRAEAVALGQRQKPDAEVLASLEHLVKENTRQQDELRAEAVAAWTTLRRGNLRKQLDALANPWLSSPAFPTPNGHRPNDAAPEQTAVSSARATD